MALHWEGWISHGVLVSSLLVDPQVHRWYAIADFSTHTHNPAFPAKQWHSVLKSKHNSTDQIFQTNIFEHVKDEDFKTITFSVDFYPDSLGMIPNLCSDEIPIVMYINTLLCISNLSPALTSLLFLSHTFKNDLVLWIWIWRWYPLDIIQAEGRAKSHPTL